MDCRDRILSNDYRDIITDYPIRLDPNEGLDICYVSIGGLFNIAYINRLGLPPIMDTLYEYQNTPKLYGLMQITGGETAGGAAGPGARRAEPFDPGSLVASGIMQVQRPPLALTGRGVVLCFIDTGIDYTNVSFRINQG